METAKDKTRIEEALALISAAININPDKTAIAYFHRAGIHQSNQNDQAALNDLNSALKILIDNSQAIQAFPVYNKRGILHAKLGNHKEALSDFEEALELNPNSLAAISNKAIALENLNRFPEALETLDKAIKLVLSNEKRNDNSSSASDLIFQKSLILVRTGDFKNAIQIISDLIIKDPENVELLRFHSQLLEKTKSLKKALEVNEKVLAIAPHSEQDWLLRGALLLQEKQFEDALEAINTVVDLNPNIPQAYSMRSNIHFAKGDIENAFADAESRIKMNPRDSDGFAMKAILFRNTNKLKEALEQINKALEFDAESTFAYRVRSSIYSQMGDKVAAEKDNQKRMELKSLKQQNQSQNDDEAELLF